MSDPHSFEALQAKIPVLERPLYVFDLPETILADLAPQGQPAVISEAESPSPQDIVESDGDQAREPGTEASTEHGPASITSCSLCGLKFATISNQRSHIRSDLHGYNLKQRIKGHDPVTEAQFEQLIEELDESISGSESDDTEEDEGAGHSQETQLSALLKRQAKLANPQNDGPVIRKPKRGEGSAPLLWFKSHSLPQNISLGFYRAIFTEPEQQIPSGLVDVIRAKQLKTTKQIGAQTAHAAPIGPHYFLCMIGGGHFAAMIVALTPQVGKKHGNDERKATVLAHKTFHRYTTRRKQGGSQSANDAAKGAAHSAGSSLRRYNEAALNDEVRQLLGEWKQLIDSSELVFIRATGTTSRRTLFGPYEGQVLRNNDPRNRGFPFSTRRATQNELMRAFVELTRVKVSHFTATDLEAATTIPKEKESTAVNKVAKPYRPTKAEEEAALHTTQITALLRRSKAPALLSYLSSNSMSPNFRFHPTDQYHHTPTPLHLAASLNTPALVSTLLIKARADPTIMNDDAKTPFQLAGDRATRDTFRVARSELGEAAWDWERANVPSALSKADAGERTAREADEKRAAEVAENERRKAEVERIRQESAQADVHKREQRHGKGRTMGGMPEKTAAEKREEETRGMSDEMKKKLERERRARAAEERMKRMANGGG